MWIWNLEVPCFENQPTDLMVLSFVSASALTRWRDTFLGRLARYLGWCDITFSGDYLSRPVLRSWRLMFEQCDGNDDDVGEVREVVGS